MEPYSVVASDRNMTRSYGAYAVTESKGSKPIETFETIIEARRLVQKPSRSVNAFEQPVTSSFAIEKE
jgi:hypothetical protein